MTLQNLLIIAGTGNKSGKTSIACRLIEQFRTSGVFSVKITPHFHETTPGLPLIFEKKGYSIYRETNSESAKDTSRMLRAGASGAFFAKVTDNKVSEAFLEIMKHIPDGSPVICESPALRHYIEPGLLVIMISENKNNQKDISKLLKLPHVKFDLADLDMDEQLPVIFENGRWSCWQYGR